LNIIHKISFILFLIIIFIGCSKKDPFPEIQLPKYPNAINPELLVNRPAKCAKALVYKLNIPFPATEVTTFYNDEIEKLGFSQAPVESIATFKWENFNEKTGEWEETNSVPARYTATWINPDKSIRIWLYMAYKYKYGNQDWEKTLEVSCNIADYFD
jgi:hypothetical protein